MEPKLTYQNSDEQEVYLQGIVNSIKFSAATLAGQKQKPNEDTFEIVANEDVLIVGVFDGTSSQKPIAALGEQTGAHFASNFLKDNLRFANKTENSHDILLNLNTKLLEKCLTLGASILDTHTLPASSGTIMKINPTSSIGEFAQVGDTYAIVFYTDGTSKVITKDTNRAFDLRMFSMIRELAKEKGISNREARQDPIIAKALIEIFIEKNNNPNGKGSGVINGDPNVQKYLQSETFSLEGVEYILLGSDGLSPQGWSIETEEDRQKILLTIQGDGFQRLFKLKKQSEDDDPEWKYVRYKDSDDATGILVSF